MHKLTLGLAILLCLLACMAAQAGPAFEIDEFIDNRDGTTCTLLVTCKGGRQLKLQFKRKQLDRINIERLYDHIDKECSRA